MALGLAVSGSAAPVDEIVVEAYIDGDTLLHVRSDSISWENGRYKKPGRRDGLDEPTYVNGVAWKPKWHDGKSDGGPDKSMPYMIQLGAGDLDVEVLSVTATRGQAGIAKDSPVAGKMEGGHYVVRIPDPGHGAQWYRFALRKKK